MLDHLDRGPVGHALAIGEASAANDNRVNPTEELGREPGLPNTRAPEHGEQVARPILTSIGKRTLQQTQLALTAHHRRSMLPRRFTGHRRDPVGIDRLGLPTHGKLAGRLRVDDVADKTMGGRADEDLTGRGRLFQPRRQIHHVARRESLLRPHDNLACGNPDPGFYVEIWKRISHLNRRTHTTQRVILMHGRYTEDSHHRVANELLHRSTMALDDRAHSVEVAREQRPQRLRVETLPKLRRPGHIAEHDGHDLALLTLRRRTLKPSATPLTEPGTVAIRMAACLTRRH